MFTGIDEVNKAVYDEIMNRWDRIAKPLGSLGRFETVIARIGAIHGTADIDISRRAVVVMCSDNGIVEEGVSQSGQDVTREVASWMGQGKSSVCLLARSVGADVIPVDIGINMKGSPEGTISHKVAKGTANFLKAPAMTVSECAQAIETGIEMVRELSSRGYRIIATGEMGIGNTTTSSALAAALLGTDPEALTARGAGLSDDGLSRKKQVIRLGLEKYGTEGADKSSPEYALKMLSCLGGLDIAGMAGLFIGGAIYHIPVIIDGFISSTAALAAERIAPGTGNYMLASHIGREKGMKPVMDTLGLQPVIDGDLALGEGTGAVLLLPLLDAVTELYTNAMTFAETKVEQYERFDRNEKTEVNDAGDKAQEVSGI